MFRTFVFSLSFFFLCICLNADDDKGMHSTALNVSVSSAFHETLETNQSLSSSEPSVVNENHTAYSNVSTVLTGSEINGTNQSIFDDENNTVQINFTEIPSSYNISDDNVSFTDGVSKDLVTIKPTDTWTTAKKMKKQWLLCTIGCECPPEDQSEIFMDCTGRHLRVLPNGIAFPLDVTGANFEKNKLKKVSEHTFVSSPHIEELDLGVNEISQIDSKAFLAFSSLTNLRLSHNKLKIVSSGVLEGLQELIVLDMGYNQLSELPQSFFKPAKNLKEVRIQYNNLRIFAEDAFEFLPNLEKLDISGNGLKLLHPSIFKNTPRLSWLSLQDNLFEEVPKKALSVPKKLNSLNLDGNRFKHLEPGAFSSLNNISTLQLNNIHTLLEIQEYAFENMTNLKTLYCSFNNKLKFIHPNAFRTREEVSQDRVPPIDHLYLRQNNLRLLAEPDDLLPWEKFTYVDLRENPWRCDCNLRWMKKVKQEIFETLRCESPLSMHGKSFSSLQEIDLECNETWMISTIILALTSILAFVVIMSFVMIFVCSRTRLSDIILAKSQFSYSKVDKKAEMVDLEWDPSADV